MKKLLCIFLFVSVLASFSFAQTPEAFKYQAVVRNPTGEILANQDIAFKIGIVLNSETGKEVYSELHKARTNEFGLVSLEIGNGTRVAGEFSKINWADGAYFIKIEFDPKGGRDFTLMGTSKMLSVPYALNAKNGFSGDYNDLHNKPINVSEFINDIGYVTREEWAQAGGTRTDPPNQYVNKYWNIDGNWTTMPAIHAIGTNDSIPLRIITNGQTRMRFEANGASTIYKELRVGKAFYANDDVFLNFQNGNTYIYGGLTVVNPKPTLLNGSLTVNGITNLNNDFNVNNMSPSHLTGTLTVEKATNLNDLLNVNNMAPTHLTGTLTVDKATNLNDLLNVNNMAPTHLTGTLTVDKATNLNSLLNVNNISPTYLSGILTVDKATNLNDLLNVNNMAPSHLTGTLTVEKPTNLNNLLNVNNASPTVLTGTLRVDQNATFKQMVTLDNAGLGSSSPANGALVVAGGVGIGQNLNVAGASTFGGDASFQGIVNFSNTTQSTATTNGAVIIGGGLGLGKNLNMGGDLNINTNKFNVASATGNTLIAGTLGVTGATSLGNTLGVTGIANFNNTTQSTTKDNGAVVIEGGLGIEKNTNIGGNLDVVGDVKFNKTLSVVTAGTLTNNSPNTGPHVALFENTNNGSGIEIKVGAPVPHNNNNFITFLNSANQTVGRIEGENGAADLATNREHNDARNFMIVDIATASADEGVAIAEEVQGGVDVAAAAASTTPCVGLGICETVPIASLIAASIVNLVLKSANLVIASTNLASATANLVVFDDTKVALFGITFASGSEDYAEYLPKANLADDMLPGEIVGVRHGTISRNTDGAEQIMVISHKPAVLGGLPADGKESEYEMVAFMGQIPTRVTGDVQRGDYILPSGFNNGIGIARHPNKMKIDDYKQILGVAWESSVGKDFSYVNVAVGLNNNDLVDVVKNQGNQIKEQQTLIDEMKNEIAKTQNVLADLIPGYREAAGLQPQNIEKTISAVAVKELADHEHYIVVPNESNIVYYQVTDSDIEKAFTLAADVSRKAGVDLSIHPFWKRIQSDPNYKANVVEDIKEKLKYAYHMHKEINKAMDFKPTQN